MIFHRIAVAVSEFQTYDHKLRHDPINIQSQATALLNQNLFSNHVHENIDIECSRAWKGKYTPLKE